MPSGMPSASDSAGRPAPQAAELLRGMRRAIASLRAATETLHGYPGAEPAMRERLLAVIADESGRLGTQLQGLEQALATAARVEPGHRTRVAVEAVARALAEALAASGLECALTGDGEQQADVEGAPETPTVEVDLDALADAAGAFFTALRRQSPVGACTLRRAFHEGHLLLDVRWLPNPSDVSRLLAWQGEALGAGGADPESGRLREVVRQHDGEAWFTLDRDGAMARIRILLPCA